MLSSVASSVFSSINSVAKLEKSQHSIKFLIHLQDGRLLSYSTQGEIKFWDLSSFQCTKIETGLPKDFSQLFQLNNGNLVSVSGDKTIIIRDITTFELIALKLVRLSAFFALPDDRLFLQEGGNASILAPSTLNALISLNLKRLDYSLNKAAIFPNQCVAFKFDNGVKVWDANSLLYITTLKTSEKERVEHIVVLKDGRFLCFLSYSILVFDIRTFKCLKTLSKNFNSFGLVQLNDGRIVAQDNNAAIKVFNGITFWSLATVETNPNFLRAMIELRDGRLALGFSCASLKSADELIHIWEV